ncbi:type II secretion system F family protein [Rhodomicrobium lacus]|uniref:type II secretion system F family protein n=1 Tax=Rhodomicrobium lacus TaxID=2498452 RepID=UPI000F8E7EC2|nr:type II secretion system F family protein [Rhodomicrobium lacus]
MASYIYKGVDRSNKIVRGTREASDKVALVKSLQADGIIPISIGERVEKTGWELGWKLSTPSIRESEILYLISNLELLLGAGVDLNAALGALSKSTKNPKIARLAKELREHVQKGQRLSSALSSIDGTVPSFVVNSIRAGENSGQLQHVLKRLAEYLSRFQQFKSNIVSSLIYPIILLIMAVVSIVILISVVIPQFKPLFEDAGVDLPLITRFFVWASDFLSNNSGLLILISIIFFILLRTTIRRPRIALLIDKVKFRLPLGAGQLLKKVEAARFARLMALMLENGVSMLTALALVRDAAGNKWFSYNIEIVAKKIREGERLTRALSVAGMIPDTYQEILEAGEEASQLEIVLARVADIAERETEISLKNFMAAFVPLLTIGLGGFVALVIMSVLLALLSVNDLALR